MILLLLSRPRYLSAHCCLNKRFLSEFCFIEICFILLYHMPIFSLITDATIYGLATIFSYFCTSLATNSADLMNTASVFMPATTFSIAASCYSLSFLFEYKSLKKFLFFFALLTNTETTTGFTLYNLATYD